MAAPTTKETWIEHCLYEPTPAERRPHLTRAQRAALPAPEQARFDASRRSYIVENRVYETRNVVTIGKRCRRLLERTTQPSPVVRRGLRVAGVSGSGKSTTILDAGRELDVGLRRRNNRAVDDLSYLPVIYVTIGDVNSDNKLWAAFAEFVGLPLSARGNADTRLYRLTAILRELGTRFVIVDEVQHLQTHKTNGAQAANALKRFAEHIDATMIYVGVDLDHAPLFTGEAGKQWRARTIPYEMSTYHIERASDRREWVDLIDAFDNDLPLCNQVAGALARQDQYLFHRTAGSIGSLKQLLTDAALDAIDDGRERITRAHLDAVVLDSAADDYAAGHRPPVRSDRRRR
ncbi:ATP-binding protein [Nocardia sp. NPDC127606]|uniref:ATP-binding protein n=1 Tax=Nocardia sp. NPDC127606 TaxID=3345406 RepID=UPI00363549CB